MKTIAVCLAALLCGCSITGHLERRQYRADVLHVSREQYEREQQTYQPPALKIERDSNRFYLVPLKEHRYKDQPALSESLECML